MTAGWRLLGRYAALVPPLLLCGLLYLLLHEPLQWWLHGDEIYDEQVMKEWLSSTVGSEAWNSRDLKSRPH